MRRGGVEKVEWGLGVFRVSVRRGEKRLVEGIGRRSERRALLLLLSQQRACRESDVAGVLAHQQKLLAPLLLLDSMLGR